MDKLPQSPHPKKATKHSFKPKKKTPLKIVYISNPMRVETSASQFRALVQQLTGRDADTASWSGPLDHRQSMVPRAVLDVIKEEEHTDEVLEIVAAPTPSVQSGSEVGTGSDLSVGDDFFMPQLMESFPDFLPSNFWYENTHINWAE